jgi:biofilm PGA synthesis N-glycosyltransferase PgaC
VDLLEGLFYLFAAVSVLYVTHIALYLAGANFYDMSQFRRRRLWRNKNDWGKPDNTDVLAVAAQGPGAKLISNLRETKGLITVAIPAHNEEKVIIRCIESILQSTYADIEIIVSDDASQDRTRQLVQDYIRRHPGIRLRVYRMRKNIGKGSALNAVLRRYARGEFVMTLDADSIIQPDTIANAVEYFNDPKIVGVAANVQIITEPTILGMLQKFEHMIGYRSKKTYSWLNCEFVVGGVASTYRIRTLREVDFYSTDTVTEDIGLSTKIISRGNRDERLVYASNVVAMTEGVMTFKALARQRFRWKYGSLQNLIKYRWLIANPHPRYSVTLTMYRMPMALLGELILLLTPLAWTYTLYMTFTQYNPQLLIGAYMTISAYLLLTLWLDENLTIRTKLHLSLYAPVMYFVLYAMDFVQLIAILRCLAKSPALVTQKNVGTTWISPKRIGKRLANVK